MFLGSTSRPVKPLKNLTEFEGCILERCFPQLRYWCLTSSELRESGGEEKAPASLKKCFPFLSGQQSTRSHSRCHIDSGVVVTVE